MSITLIGPTPTSNLFHTIKLSENRSFSRERAPHNYTLKISKPPKSTQTVDLFQSNSLKPTQIATFMYALLFCNLTYIFIASFSSVLATFSVHTIHGWWVGWRWLISSALYPHINFQLLGQRCSAAYNSSLLFQEAKRLNSVSLFRVFHWFVKWVEMV